MDTFKQHTRQNKKLEKIIRLSLAFILEFGRWNPIEHRLFSHLHRAWQGSVFHDIETAKELAETTHTTTGLGLKARINPQAYYTKRMVNPHFKENITEYVHFDPDLPQWNYTFHPKKRKLIF